MESSRRRSPPASCGSRPGRAWAPRTPTGRPVPGWRRGRPRLGGSGGRTWTKRLRTSSAPWGGGTGIPDSRTFAGCRDASLQGSRSPTSRRRPAIDRQDYARRELGVREIERRVDDLGDIADPLHRRHRLQKLVRPRIVHRRIYESRRDRIDPNAFRRQLERKRASRLVDTAFDEDGEERRNVRLWLTRKACGNVDDRAGTALGHVARGLLARIEEALQVRADHLLDVVDDVVGGRLCDEDARIVDEHVDVPESFERYLEQTLADFGSADVSFDRDEAVGRAERALNLLQARLRACVGNDHITAVEKCLSQRQADSTRGSRHDRGLRAHLHPPSSLSCDAGECLAFDGFP